MSIRRNRGTTAFVCVAIGAGVSGCEAPPGQFDYAGYAMEEFFPFDGDRWWKYSNDDPEVANQVLGTLDPAYETLNGNVTRAYTIRYTIECPNDELCTDGEPWRLSSWKLSSDQTYGTLIYSMETAETGPVTFDPPIALTGEHGKAGDMWETQTGDQRFVSQFVSYGACDVHYTSEWDNCVRLHLDDDGDLETPTTHPLHGDYYAVPGYNIIRFWQTPDGEGDDGAGLEWRLIDQNWDPA